MQTEIRVGNIGIARKHSDYMALDLAVKVLGGEGANRLHRVLRTERGLTYGASADMNGLKETGDIVAETNTRSQTTGETLRLMVDEFWRLIRDRVNERELEGAQEYLTGSFPLTIETPSQIALQVLNAVFYGLNLNELQTYRERVDAVTVDDVQRVAREYLHPDRLTIVLVGDATSFVNQLPGAGFDHFERIPLAELDLSAVDLRRKTSAPVGAVKPIAYRVPQTATPLRPATSSQTDGQQSVIAQAIAAKGGLDRLQQIQSLRAEATTRVTDRQATGTISTVTLIQYPDRYRVEADADGRRIVQVYADGRYWIQDAQGAREAPVSVRERDPCEHPARRRAAAPARRGRQADAERRSFRRRVAGGRCGRRRWDDARDALRRSRERPHRARAVRGARRRRRHPGAVFRLPCRQRRAGGVQDRRGAAWRAADRAHRREHPLQHSPSGVPVRQAELIRRCQSACG